MRAVIHSVVPVQENEHCWRLSFRDRGGEEIGCSAGLYTKEGAERTAKSFAVFKLPAKPLHPNPGTPLPTNPNPA